MYKVLSYVRLVFLITFAEGPKHTKDIIRYALSLKKASEKLMYLAAD